MDVESPSSILIHMGSLFGCPCLELMRVILSLSGIKNKIACMWQKVSRLRLCEMRVLKYFVVNEALFYFILNNSVYDYIMFHLNDGEWDKTKKTVLHIWLWDNVWLRKQKIRIIFTGHVVLWNWIYLLSLSRRSKYMQWKCDNQRQLHSVKLHGHFQPAGTNTLIR